MFQEKEIEKCAWKCLKRCKMQNIFQKKALTLKEGECSVLKNQLLAMEDRPGSGRVSLSDFYQPALNQARLGNAFSSTSKHFFHYAL